MTLTNRALFSVLLVQHLSISKNISVPTAFLAMKGICVYVDVQRLHILSVFVVTSKL